MPRLIVQAAVEHVRGPAIFSLAHHHGDQHAAIEPIEPGLRGVAVFECRGAFFILREVVVPKRLALRVIPLLLVDVQQLRDGRRNGWGVIFAGYPRSLLSLPGRLGFGEGRL